MPEEPPPEPPGTGRTPLSQLGILVSQEVEVAPGVSHLELYTRTGLLSVLWHGEQSAPAVAVMGGGRPPLPGAPALTRWLNGR